ncbi:hypothetical protein CEH09_13505 [Listeria monocytogenes]|nr:hypothetical protein [Listeria monocytogenes]TYW25155.1 hypothetical protein FZ084_14795 [Listeria monocytogenes]
MLYDLGEKGLFIIGNGLDLEAKLPSKFIDFYKHRCDLMELDLDEITYNLKEEQKILITTKIFYGANQIDDFISIESLPNSANLNERITFWDFILLFSLKKSGDLRWCSIETQIEEVLEWLNDYLNLTVVDFFDVLKRGKKHSRYTQLSMYSIEDVSKALEKEKGGNQLKAALYLSYMIFLRKEEPQYNNVSVGTFLMLELKRYEDDFKEYINSKKTREYLNNRSKIIDSILNKSPNIEKVNILNFNFTKNNFQEDLVLKNKVDKEVNIHGISEEDVIFGIDNEKITPESEAYDFTKTYRKLISKGDGKQGLLSKDVSEIIFFGHSLSDADFSYFQSIFDYLDIYSAEISLKFYYVNYKNNAELVRREETKAVRSLILKYGESMDNQKKGKNILHKLLLEERISVLEK